MKLQLLYLKKIQIIKIIAFKHTKKINMLRYILIYHIVARQSNLNNVFLSCKKVVKFLKIINGKLGKRGRVKIDLVHGLSKNCRERIA